MLPKVITPPSFQWIKVNTNDDRDLRVHEWIVPFQENQEMDWDVVILGVPLSRSSISASGASEFPEAFRRSWKSFATYNLDNDVDLSTLKVCDLGDVKMHYTNILQCHQNIYEAMTGILKIFPNSLTVAIGGDHSITAMLLKGLKEVNKDQTIGILQFDTHLDLRDLKDHGPTNGTPIRQLIETGTVKGKHIYNIGLHGFFNTRSLIDYAKKHEVNMIPLRKARKEGINHTVKKVLEVLNAKVDLIYVTVDMDVLDIAVAPGVPASTPGGMLTYELFECLETVGAHPKVKAMDIVCLDPLKDFPQQTTVKAGTHAFLSFLTGFKNR